MQVLLNTRYGRIYRLNYEAGKPDAYGNSNDPVITTGNDGPFCHIVFV